MPDIARDARPAAIERTIRLRRTGGRFLALTRSTIIALERESDVPTRVVIADRFVHQARHLLDHLRDLEIADARAFRAFVDRLVDRLTTIRAAVPVLCDASDTVALLAAELLILSGDPDAAADRMRALALSITRVQGRDLRDEIVERYMDLCVARVEIRDGVMTFVGYLTNRIVHGGSRFTRHLRLFARHPEMLAAFSLNRTAWLVRRWSQLGQVPPRRLSRLVADMILQRIGPRVMRRDLRAIRGASDAPRVVRSMGGIGDLLMMTPGLRALSKRVGQPIEFAVPSRFLPLFEQNASVQALALEALPADWFAAGPLIDLTDCPASVEESRTAPNVRVNRIEIFARAMGITPAELRTHGLRPAFTPGDEARRRADRWLAERGLSGTPFIAVQAASAESYRTWSGMAATARALARRVPIVVFDDKSPAGFDNPSPVDTMIHFAVGLDLATSFALACEARMIVAPDSAFVHLAGARDIPCVSVFGPTDGALRTGAYADSVVVSRAADLPCIPCWRNQRTACVLTGGMASHCLDTLPVEAVDAAASVHLGNVGFSA